MLATERQWAVIAGISADLDAAGARLKEEERHYHATLIEPTPAGFWRVITEEAGLGPISSLFLPHPAVLTRDLSFRSWCSR